jgi:hypothetical protein
MTAKELLAMMDQGKTGKARSLVGKATDTVYGTEQPLSVNTPEGLRERVTSVKADSDAERQELLVRLQTEAIQKDVSSQANEVQKTAAVDYIINAFLSVVGE